MDIILPTASREFTRMKRKYLVNDFYSEAFSNIYVSFLLHFVTQESPFLRPCGSFSRYAL